MEKTKKNLHVTDSARSPKEGPKRNFSTGTNVSHHLDTNLKPDFSTSKKREEKNSEESPTTRQKRKVTNKSRQMPKSKESTKSGMAA